MYRSTTTREGICCRSNSRNVSPSMNIYFKWNVLTYLCVCVLCKYQILILFGRKTRLGLQFFHMQTKIVGCRNCTKLLRKMNMGLTHSFFVLSSPHFSMLAYEILWVPLLRLLADCEVDIIRALFQQFTGWIGRMRVRGCHFEQKRTLQPNNSVFEIINMFSTNNKKSRYLFATVRHGKRKTIALNYYRFVARFIAVFNFDDDFDGHTLWKRNQNQNWLANLQNKYAIMYPLSGEAR